MLYNPRNLIKKDGAFVFGGTVKAEAHEALCKEVFCEFWQGFSFRLSTLVLEESDALLFRIGEAEPLPTDGYDYTVNVTKSGICLAAKSARDLIHAYMALIDRIEATDGEGCEALRSWCFAIEKPKVRALLREVRRELCELCGEGDYFHIGCDEAYGFDLSVRENAAQIIDFINEVSAELREVGRRAIVWGDMLIAHRPSHRAGERYTCNAPSLDAEEFMLGRLSRDVLIADWQYDAKNAPVESVFAFHEAGFDTLLCPWDRGMAQMRACLDTVKNEQLFGLMHTTWHTLETGHYFLSMASVGCFENENARQSYYLTQSATLARKVAFADGDYEKAGFAKRQIAHVVH